MAPHHSDKQSTEASAEAADMANSSSTREAEQILPIRLVKYLIGRPTQDAVVPTELKEEKPPRKMEPNEVFVELSELKERYRRVKESERELRHANEKLNDAYGQLAGERDMFSQRFHALTEQLHDSQNESHELRKQLQTEQMEKRRIQDQVAQFKKMISSSSQMENQLADDVIRTKSDQIFYSIQDFVVKTFRGPRFDFAKLPRNTKAIMREYAPGADDLPKAFWLNLINSFIAQVFLSSFRPSRFFGEGEEMPIASAKGLARAFEGTADVKWLTSTRKMLSENAVDALQFADIELAKNQVDLIHSILCNAIAVEWTPEVSQQLVEIFKRAQEFYRLVSSQQPQLVCVLPEAKIDGEAQPFDPEVMEIVHGGSDDETALAGIPIAISVFPAVFKKGASSSSHNGGGTVVAKAKIVLHV